MFPYPNPCALCLTAAYKNADGRKIDGRRVLVDVERARTVRGWRPRRLGGGLGTTRRGAPEINSRHSGRDDRDRSRSRERKHGNSPRPFRPVEKGRDRERERDRDRNFDRKPRDEKRNRGSRSRSRERRHKRSRTPERDRNRDKDRRRDTNRRRSGSRERDRKSRREDRNGGVSASVRQYGEYGAEIAEYGDS